MAAAAAARESGAVEGVGLYGDYAGAEGSVCFDRRRGSWSGVGASCESLVGLAMALARLTSFAAGRLDLTQSQHFVRQNSQGLGWHMGKILLLSSPDVSVHSLDSL